MKLLKLIEHTAVRILLIAVVAAFVIVPSTVAAYGPARDTFTIAKPASYVTFNSITDNPNYGDERNFLLVKDAANTSAGGWSDTVNVVSGKEYLVRLYVHNNAAANLNLVANNTRVMANVPNASGTSIDIDGFITADNASPKQVWDDVTLNSASPFTVGYVAGSAKYYNNVNSTSGFALTDGIVTSAGTPVGYNAMDGNVQGCFEYSGIATFKVKVLSDTNPNFTVEKKVRIHGSADWSANTISAKPGDTLDYQIGYKNTGNASQYNVVAKDTLPQGVTYVNNTTTLKNASNPNGNGMALSSNSLTKGPGVNIGNYAVGSNAYVRFSAKLPTNDQLVKCGTNTFRNTAIIETDNGAKQDSVDVTVTKTCAPGTVTPPTLPKTGPTEIIAVLVSVMALAIVGSYIIHRRKLLHEYAESLEATEHQLLLPQGEAMQELPHEHQEIVIKPTKK